MDISKRMLTASLIIISMILVSCEKDEPVIPNPEELITTLTYTLTPAGGGTAIDFTFFDPDGDGGVAPVVTSQALEANTSYTASVTLLNETEMPAENITEEVEEEAADHQFFFSVVQADLTVAYDDSDPDGLPLGLETTVSTGDTSQGTLTVTLRHEPDKSAPGVSDGQLLNAGGETDIEVTFDITIQ